MSKTTVTRADAPTRGDRAEHANTQPGAGEINVPGFTGARNNDAYHAANQARLAGGSDHIPADFSIGSSPPPASDAPAATAPPPEDRPSSQPNLFAPSELTPPPPPPRGDLPPRITDQHPDAQKPPHPRTHRHHHGG